jgi:hypothetical protein
MKPALQTGGRRLGTRIPASSSRPQAAVASPWRREVGGFRLEFAPSGKLRTLVLPSGAAPLHREDRDFDVGGGRLFRPEGWDECFPTIEPWNGSPAMGELVWAEPVVREARGGFEQAWTRPAFVAERSFRLRSARELELTFRVRNLSGRPLEFLWASHAVFSLTDLAEVELPDGRLLGDLSLDGSCSKFFVRSGPALRLRRTEGEVRLRTDQPWWGIWLNRGGWPAERPAGMGCIGIEATNCAADCPGGAVLEAGAPFRGTVIVEDRGGR